MNYVKMNENKKYLSIGNIVINIKNISSNKKIKQSEIFSLLFQMKNIKESIVNNYITGYRAIGIEYKNIYIDLKEKYSEDKLSFYKIVSNILHVLDNSEEDYKNDIELINKNYKLKSLCIKIFDIAKKDEKISLNFINNIEKLFSNKNYYEMIVEFLIYAILENEQPIYIQNIKANINKAELEEYMKVKLYEGTSYITSLVRLSEKNNVYACAELGLLEYTGLVTGKINYQKSYEYYLKASAKNHPKACSMVARIILDGKIPDSESKLDIAWLYLNRASSLGSSAALNTLGSAYLKGKTPDRKKDIEKAKEYFTLSSELGYPYAYNNLGLLEEGKGNIEEAIKYYKISASLGESWALNKVGEYYRKNGNKKLAYDYYLKSSEAPISERNFYSYYNLAKYYFLRNKKTTPKGKEYLKEASNHGIKKAAELLKKMS